MKLVDLTRPIEQISIAEFPEPLKPLYRILCPEIDYVAHDRGAAIMCDIFGCAKDELPEGEGWAEENISLSTHLGTHVDAPWHYGSKTGEDRAITVDEIALEDLYLDAVVLDMTHLLGTACAITVEHIEAALDKIDYKIKARDAVLIYTGHDRFALTDLAKYAYPGLTGESARYIAECGAIVGGTDALGFDRPFPAMVAHYQASGDKSHIWDAHYAMRDFKFYVVQQLANLGSLPSNGFKVAFFPLKIKAASAAPARVVAFLPD